MTKKPKWYEKHREANDQLRAMSGAKMGDGLNLLDKMKRGNEAQRAMYKLYRDMSVDQADALISHYAQNPLLRLFFDGKSVEFSQKISEKNPKKSSEQEQNKNRTWTNQVQSRTGVEQWRKNAKIAGTLDKKTVAMNSSAYAMPQCHSTPSRFTLPR